MAAESAAKLAKLSVHEGAPAPELGARPVAASGGATVAPAQADDHDGVASAPTTRQAAALVDGVQTDVVVQSYENLVFCIVTQNQKLGTFVRADAKVGHDGELSLSLDVLLGKRDEPLLFIYARQVLERMRAAGCAKPLLLAISLKDERPECFRAVMEMVVSARVW